MGVKFVGVRDSDSVVAIALNPEITADELSRIRESAAARRPRAGSLARRTGAEDQAPADPEPAAPGVEEDDSE